MRYQNTCGFCHIWSFYKEETTDWFEIPKYMRILSYMVILWPRTDLRYQNTCGFCGHFIKKRPRTDLRLHFVRRDHGLIWDTKIHADFVIYGHFIKKRPRTDLRYQNTCGFCHIWSFYCTIYGHFIKKRPRTDLRYQNTCGFCHIWSFYKEETTDWFEIPKYMRILSYMVIL